MNFKTMIIPMWAIPYLMNDDADGLTSEEIATIDRWWSENRVQTVTPAADAGESEEIVPHFSSHPAFGLPCESIECIVMTL